MAPEAAPCCVAVTVAACGASARVAMRRRAAAAPRVTCGCGAATALAAAARPRGLAGAMGPARAVCASWAAIWGRLLAWIWQRKQKPRPRVTAHALSAGIGLGTAAPNSRIVYGLNWGAGRREAESEAALGLLRFLGPPTLPRWWWGQ